MTLDPRVTGLLERWKFLAEVTILLPRITWFGEEKSGDEDGFLVITVTIPPPRAERPPGAPDSGNGAVTTLAARTTEPCGATAVLVERMTEFGINGGGTPIGNMFIGLLGSARHGDAKSCPEKP